MTQIRHGLARRTDPQTRTIAYLIEANRYEISRASGLTEYQTGRRLSELERDRRIEWTGRTRPGATGRQQRVYTVAAIVEPLTLWPK